MEELLAGAFEKGASAVASGDITRSELHLLREKLEKIRRAPMLSPNLRSISPVRAPGVSRLFGDRTPVLRASSAGGGTQQEAEGQLQGTLRKETSADQSWLPPKHVGEILSHLFTIPTIRGDSWPA